MLRATGPSANTCGSLILRPSYKLLSVLSFMRCDQLLFQQKPRGVLFWVKRQMETQQNDPKLISLMLERSTAFRSSLAFPNSSRLASRNTFSWRKPRLKKEKNWFAFSGGIECTDAARRQYLQKALKTFLVLLLYTLPSKANIQMLIQYQEVLSFLFTAVSPQALIILHRNLLFTCFVVAR